MLVIPSSLDVWIRLGICLKSPLRMVFAIAVLLSKSSYVAILQKLFQIICLFTSVILIVDGIFTNCWASDHKYTSASLSLILS